MQNRNGAAVVFMSTSASFSGQNSRIEYWPVVSKPFLDQTLIFAIGCSVEIAHTAHQIADAMERPLSDCKGAGR